MRIPDRHDPYHHHPVDPAMLCHNYVGSVQPNLHVVYALHKHKVHAATSLKLDNITAIVKLKLSNYNDK